MSRVRFEVTAGVLLLAALVAGCANAPKAKPNELTRVENLQAASVRWTASVGKSSTRDAVKFSPFVTDDSLYAVDQNGKLTAFDVQSGKASWTTELNKNITAGVSGDKDNLYVATANGEVLAISQVHGGVLWTSTVSSEVIAAPVAGSDYVVVRSIDGKVYALEKSTGERRWIYSYSVPALSIHGNGRPLVVADGVLAGLDNGKLVALRAADGQVFWEISLGDSSGRSEVEKLNDLDADIQIFEPYIYAVNYQGKLAQVDAAQGRAVWSTDVSSVAGLAVTATQVFVTDEFDTLWAFRRNDGELMWKQEGLGNRRLTGPVATESGSILVGDFEGYLHILSAEDGSMLGRVKLGVGAIAGRPVLRDNSLFVQGRAGKVAAVQL